MDTLIFWMYAADGAVDSLTFGNSPRRSSSDVMFRLRNLSALYTAQDVTVTITGERAHTYYLSLDGDLFTAQIELGDLAPGTYTEGITLRRVTPSDAPLGDEAVKVIATAASWTPAT